MPCIPMSLRSIAAGPAAPQEGTVYPKTLQKETSDPNTPLTPNPNPNAQPHRVSAEESDGKPRFTPRRCEEQLCSFLRRFARQLIVRGR